MRPLVLALIALEPLTIVVARTTASPHTLVARLRA
jgi:hypothetical protein